MAKVTLLTERNKEIIDVLCKETVKYFVENKAV